MLNVDVNELPSTGIISQETEHILLSFCTLCTMLKGKKMSFQNVFIMVLENKELRDILTEMLCIESNYELVKMFINHDPLITTSKYVTKFLNANPDINFR